MKLVDDPLLPQHWQRLVPVNPLEENLVGTLLEVLLPELGTWYSELNLSFRPALLRYHRGPHQQAGWFELLIEVLAPKLDRRAKLTLTLAMLRHRKENDRWAGVWCWHAPATASEAIVHVIDVDPHLWPHHHPLGRDRLDRLTRQLIGQPSPWDASQNASNN